MMNSTLHAKSLADVSQLDIYKNKLSKFLLQKTAVKAQRHLEEAFYSSKRRQFFDRLMLHKGKSRKELEKKKKLEI